VEFQLRLRSLAVSVLCLSVLLPAQQTATLHVYTDRVQIPVLVLGAHREELPPLTQNSFQVKLDLQNLPATIRRQGHDPLEITLLLDLSDPQNTLTAQFDGQIDALFPNLLSSADHVSVFAMDGCTLRRFRTMDPADAQSISHAVQKAALSPAWKPEANHPCPAPINLWDSMYVLTSSMTGRFGRSILLAITNGVDHGSTRNYSAVRIAAIRNGTGVFSIAQKGKVPGGVHANLETTFDISSASSALANLCEGSGGMILEAEPHDVSNMLPKAIRLIRGRYILEFPRPKEMFGTHQLFVTLWNRRAFVRAGGISFPVAHAPVEEILNPADFKPLEFPNDPAPGRTTSPSVPPVK
jgi:hypothetical protein